MNLEDVRNKIDLIDSNLLELLAKRVKLVKEVGKIKHRDNQGIYRPEREAFIIERLEKLSKEQNFELSKEAIEAIYLEIFAISRYIEKPESIAYLGPIGSFTNIAAESRFGALATYLALDSIDSVFDALQRKIVKYAVLPIENSNEGVVVETIDNLGQKDAKIIGELSLQIKQTLASRTRELSNIKKIYSKDIAYLQCKNTLKRYNLSNVEFIPVTSTAKAAKLASLEEDSAAICSDLAAKLSSLPILIDNLQDNLANETRFLILSDFETKPSNSDKTTILLKLQNDKPGNLRQVLSVFEAHKINLYKIESRPIKDGTFSYQFFIDFAGHIQDENVKSALSEFKDVKWLGSYPKNVN